ncbi:MAG: NFACT family protein [Thermoplasmata archaeon]|nr:NFACT family protein [Thermoplasmata archaeon]
MAGVPTPKDRFTSLDTLALVREIRALARPRVDKVFDAAGGGWSLAFRVPGEGRRELLLVPGKYAALLTTGDSPHSEELSPLARELRRLLVGAGLRGAAEPAGERYLELALGRSDDPEPLLLALEMFGTGNLIVAQSGKIVAVAQARRWAHRQVRIGADYTRPPVRLDPWVVGRAELEAELARSRNDLASTLAARLSFGGPVAEELIVRAGLDGAEPASARPPIVAERLHAAIAELLREVGDRPNGFVYLREGAIVDATPYPSRRWTHDPSVEQATRPTFSDAAHEYFRSLVIVPPSAAEAEAEKTRKGLERLHDQQSAAIVELTESIRTLQATAETIFAHYPQAEAALEAARSTGGADARVTVTLGDREVALRTDRTPRESAQEVYAEVKRLQSKVAGARAALAETDAKAARPRIAPGRVARRAAAETERSRKPHWFERFRWFISSEGAVVIAGRDASSNDLIVRRNMKDGDLYVHADLHGAASVIVKHPPPGEPAVTEATLREAGQWAVVYSKAWRAGLASASAFWVTHEQVSKAASSGEFVARGAWAIHGTKHILKDLPTELGLGTIDYRGETLWTAAPPSAVGARGTVRAVLVPGEERERDALEVELAGELGLTRTRLQSLLPAGGISRRRA